ncbi:hypothetical protein OPT61_g10105 [Boeremia exigua]|uniref:Uncharacterized protein n=1 Tax=Boeremia exigua TaxID=749465 RepID=A0ACC2HS25_9PLEO|nr:hypothetical protein OPT61_g10105 [Boeremia exigua]
MPQDIDNIDEVYTHQRPTPANQHWIPPTSLAQCLKITLTKSTPINKLCGGLQPADGKSTPSSVYREHDRPWSQLLVHVQDIVHKSQHSSVQCGNASRLAFGPGKIKLFQSLGIKKPFWEQGIPEELWKDGNALCTSFAVSVNTVAHLGATYIECKGTHRAAHKVDKGKSTIVIDSSAKKRVLKFREEYQEDGRGSCWKSSDCGEVSWQDRTPRELPDERAAMHKCLNQLWKTALWGMVLTRWFPNKILCYFLFTNGIGRKSSGNDCAFGDQIWISFLHQAIRICEPIDDGFAIVSYLVFSHSHTGQMKDESELQRHLNRGQKAQWRDSVAGAEFDKL